MKNSVLFLTNAYPDFESSYRGVFIQKMAVLSKKRRISDFCSDSERSIKRSSYFEEKDGIKVYRFPFFARDKLLIEHKKIPYLK